MTKNFPPFLTLEKAYQCLFAELGHIEAWMPDREQFLCKVWDHLAAAKLVAVRDGAEIPVAAWDTRPEWSGFKIRRDDVLTMWGRGPMRRSTVPRPETPWPVPSITVIREAPELAAAAEETSPPRVTKRELGEYLKMLGPISGDDGWEKAKAHFGTSIDRDLIRHSAARVKPKRGPRTR